MSSFIKFREQTRSGNQALHWHRANLDGAPFRGPAQPPFLKEDEWEELTERVWDVQVAHLNISQPEERERLVEVLEGAANGWYRVLFIDRQFLLAERTYLVYLEYAVPYKELPPERLRQQTSQIMNHGR